MKFAETVWVRNNGDFVHKDKFDGDEFELPPNGFVQIHQAAAELCFGFGRENKLPTLRRLGWVETNGDLARGIAKLNVFSFHSSESEAKGHRVRKPIAPADESSEVGAGAGKPAPDAAPTNLLGKLAAVAQAGA